ncbi:MAG: hypothetical protein KGZ63_00650 [Clostridiales bacterium]|jgi:hypothetical protein|nr:hypothetical protein [Clostridiales bacterium]
MSEYYYDEELAMAYKVDPVVASMVEDEARGVAHAVLVHTNVKITNFKKEKIRRIISEVYPSDQYDMDAAKKAFEEKVLGKLLSTAVKIPKDEYDRIKKRVEAAY